MYVVVLLQIGLQIGRKKLKWTLVHTHGGGVREGLKKRELLYLTKKHKLSGPLEQDQVQKSRHIFFIAAELLMWPDRGR